MGKFTLGDVVKRTKGSNGVVRAIFTTKEGELMYAVEKEGALDFVDEAKLTSGNAEQAA